MYGILLNLIKQMRVETVYKWFCTKNCLLQYVFLYFLRQTNNSAHSITVHSIITLNINH